MVTMAIPTILLSSHRRLLDSKHKTRSPDQHEATSVILWLFFFFSFKNRFKKVDKTGLGTTKHLDTSELLVRVRSHEVQRTSDDKKSAHIRLALLPKRLETNEAPQ